MLFYRKLVVLFFVFQCAFSLVAQNNTACSVGADIKTCNSNVSLQSVSQVPGSWKIIAGGGILANSNINSTTVSVLPEGISSFVWVNNDNSCRDTVSVMIPKMGVTTPTIIGGGKVISSAEVKVSFGSVLKFNTVGSVLPQTIGNVSSVAYFLYTCQPPSFPDVLNDACVNKGAFENINNLKNDGVLTLKKPVISQTYWSVPVLSNDITLQGPQIDPTCQKTGSSIKFTLLNDITYTIKDFCKDGMSEIVFYGGDAEFFGTKLTISNIVSKKAIFSSKSFNHGEKITITQLTNGETISFDVTDAIGYKITLSYMFPPCPACITTIGYNTNYCRYDSIASPIFYNNSGIGRLKVVPSTGLIWDTITGIVDVRNSLPGVYSIKNITSKSCAKQDTSKCTLNLLDVIAPPISPAVDTLCKTNSKIGDVKSVVAQLITWYDKIGNKLNPEISPAVDGVTYYSTQTINGCESAKVPIKIIAPKVSPPVADPIQFVCKEKAPTLSNLQPSGSNISWYASAIGGNKLDLTKQLTETKYYATIKLSCESQQRLEVSVKFDVPPIPKLKEDSLFYCYSADLTLDSLKPFGKQYVWYAKLNDVDSLKSKDKLEQGTYYVSYLNPSTSCQSAKSKVRVFITEITANVKVFEPNCDDNDGAMQANPSQGSIPYSFNWSSGNQSASIERVSEGVYKLEITDVKGCRMDTLINVGCRKIIPSILTPDGNGKNDVWIVGYSEQYPNLKVLIYNRWGNLVYESDTPYKDNWDGRSNVVIDQPYVPAGTYYYQIIKKSDSLPESGFIEVIK